MVRHVLVAVGTSCAGGAGNRISKGFVATVEECAEKCKNNSSVFTFGRKGFPTCNPHDCECNCETGASADRTCEPGGNKEYNLYRYISGSIYLIENVLTLFI